MGYFRGIWGSLSGLLLSVAMIACASGDSGMVLHSKDYLIFGHFFGECFGEGCVQTYKLTNTELYEDTLDEYGGGHFEFQALSHEQFLQVKELAKAFPDRLLSERDSIIGCPDCTDGGGLLIELSTKNVVHRWQIDLDKAHVPNYLHPFMDEINAKIGLLNP